MVSVKVVSHYQLLSEDIGQTSVGALGHHRLGVLRQLPVQLLLQLLLLLDFLQLLDENLGELRRTELVTGFSRDPLCPRYEVVRLRVELVLPVLPALLLDPPGLPPQILLVVL